MDAEQVVACYLDNQGEFLFVPFALDENGPWRAINRTQLYHSPVGDDLLGAAIRRALQYTDFSLFDPKIIPHLAATGCKSWPQFAKTRRLVRVEFADSITLVPCERDRRGAFHWMSDSGLRLPLNVSNEELGAAIRQAFSLCREEAK